MEYKRGGDPEWTPLTGKAHGSLSGHVAVHVARRLLDIDPEPGEVTEIPPRNRAGRTLLRSTSPLE